MIRCTEGSIEVMGNGAEILAELEGLTVAIFKSVMKAEGTDVTLDIFMEFNKHVLEDLTETKIQEEK